MSKERAGITPKSSGFVKGFSDFAPYLQRFAAVHRKTVLNHRKLAHGLFCQNAGCKSKASQIWKIFGGNMEGINTTVVVTTYISYVVLSVVLTVWVAQTLHKNGRVFLVEVFNNNEALADSVNHLLVVGFYLINFGYVSLALKMSQYPENAAQGIESLSWKIGLVLLVLGGMHFMNLLIFQRIHRRPKFKNYPPMPRESVVNG
jgi:hypothetical protein